MRNAIRARVTGLAATRQLLQGHKCFGVRTVGDQTCRSGQNPRFAQRCFHRQFEPAHMQTAAAGQHQRVQLGKYLQARHVDAIDGLGQEAQVPDVGVRSQVLRQMHDQAGNL